MKSSWRAMGLYTGDLAEAWMNWAAAAKGRRPLRMAASPLVCRSLWMLCSASSSTGILSLERFSIQPGTVSGLRLSRAAMSSLPRTSRMRVCCQISCNPSPMRGVRQAVSMMDFGMPGPSQASATWSSFTASLKCTARAYFRPFSRYTLAELLPRWKWWRGM